MKKIIIQGAGFVGSAFAIACAGAKKNNNYIFEVSIIEQKDQNKLIRKINKGIFPFKTNDEKLPKLIKKHIGKNLSCSTDINKYYNADIIVSCISFDCNSSKKSFKENSTEYLKSLKIIAQRMRPETLLIIQSTLPPGFTNLFIKPLFEKEFKKRNISSKNLLLAHSFERVMPGKNYYDSIVNNWRVYAGINKISLKKCKNFFSTFINVKKYPLKNFINPIYSEVAKILENTYRAVNISFIDEWSRYAEMINVNLFEIIDTIRLRPTHNNMMYPGFGVGGYCLTKDPNFLETSSKFIFNNNKLKFPHTKSAIRINKSMPLATFEKLNSNFSNKIKNKKILILGVSYKDGVADTRRTPTKTLYDKLKKKGAIVDFHDPLVKYWPEKKIEIKNKIPDFNNYNALILATKHKEYKKINFKKKIKYKKKILILDTVNIVKEKFNSNFKIKLISIGK